MDFDQLSEDGQADLLKSLQGVGGYTDEDGTARVAELSGVARIAFLASDTLIAAARNMLPTKAIELLDEYELLFDTPPNERLTTLQRQARIKLFMRSLPKLLAHKLDNAAAQLVGASTGSTTVHGAAVQILGHAPARGGFHVARYEPAADDQELIAIDALMRRGAPARCMVSDTATKLASYGSGSIDRAVLEPFTVPSASSITHARVAPIEFYVGSTVRTQDWREVQAMALWKSKGFTLTQSDQGRTIVISGSVPGLTTNVVDAGDWENRVIQLWGVASQADITAADLSALALSAFVWLAPSKTNTIGSPNIHPLQDLSGPTAPLEIFHDGAGLKLRNNIGFAVYYILIIRGTPKYTGGSSVDSEPWIDPEDITLAGITDLWETATLQDSTLTNSDKGGSRRVFSTGTLSKVAADETQAVVLDSSQDWRGRKLLVLPLVSSHATQNVAPQTTGIAQRTALASVPRIFRTGPGAVIGSATALAYQHPDVISSPNIWLFADSATGDLIAEMKSTASTAARACALLLVWASEREADDGFLVDVPASGSAPTAFDLNTLQDVACYSQGRQKGAPRQAIEDIRGTAITAAPLGEISDSISSPRSPAVWDVRERVGRADDAVYQHRQPLFRQRKRITSVLIGAGLTVDLDTFQTSPDDAVDQVDYRDRVIWLEGRQSATGIDIPGANASDIAATRLAWVFYSGPYDTLGHTYTAGSLVFDFIWTRKPNGYSSKLTARNTSGSAISLNVAIDLSPHLGLADRRLYGARP